LTFIALVYAETFSLSLVVAVIELLLKIQLGSARLIDNLVVGAHRFVCRIVQALVILSRREHLHAQVSAGVAHLGTLATQWLLREFVMVEALVLAAVSIVVHLFFLSPAHSVAAHNHIVGAVYLCAALVVTAEAVLAVWRELGSS